MDEFEQAHHELERLQGIISRHEGHMFVLRGWLLTVVGGLLAAYYTANIQMSVTMLQIALPMVTLLFLIVESRHANLVEVVAERVGTLEDKIVDARKQNRSDWYDGPRVSETCERGVARWLPRREMTFLLNQAFYVVVILIIFIATVSLPPRAAPAAPAPAAAAGP